MEKSPMSGKNTQVCFFFCQFLFAWAIGYKSMYIVQSQNLSVHFNLRCVLTLLLENMAGPTRLLAGGAGSTTSAGLLSTVADRLNTTPPDLMGEVALSLERERGGMEVKVFSSEMGVEERVMECSWK